MVLHLRRSLVSHDFSGLLRFSDLPRFSGLTRPEADRNQWGKEDG